MAKNRVIKFRAWNGVSMEYGGFNVHASGKLQNEVLGRVNEDSPFMQFTGLLDKNGKGIYEGDVLSFAMKQKKYAIPQEDKPEVVHWNSRKAAWYFGRFSLGAAIDYIDSEIIGNIYENPELATRGQGGA